MYIQSTFIHLDKLGVHKEKELWNKNIAYSKYLELYKKVIEASGK